MTIHIKILCGCQKPNERWVGIKISKKRFIEENYFICCDKCDWRCQILEIKNEREYKLDKILDKIKEDD